MPLADDLMAQSEMLASHERGRPKQASLRRAVSSAYYALFHLILDDTVSLVARGQRPELQDKVRKKFTHRGMKDACKTIVNQKNQRPGSSPSNPVIAQRLREVAGAFGDLQQERHRADYDMAKKFVRAGTLSLIAKARTAIQNWRAVRQSPEAIEFLYDLLLQN